MHLCTRWVAFIPVKTKSPAEVITMICTHWFHCFGVPEFIMSDRGKEFLGVMTAVCEVLDITHIKTTPYHPRANGLCEAQHKMLTTELHIHSCRPSTSEWDALTTEISFAQNVTPIETMTNLSPFNLVYGRNPRLSAKDICFPSKKHASHRESVP